MRKNNPGSQKSMHRYNCRNMNLNYYFLNIDLKCSLKWKMHFTFRKPIYALVVPLGGDSVLPGATAGHEYTVVNSISPSIFFSFSFFSLEVETISWFVCFTVALQVRWKDSWSPWDLHCQWGSHPAAWRHSHRSLRQVKKPIPNCLHYADFNIIKEV